MALYSFADAGVYCLQQTISGAGVFDGTPVGYASYTYSAGGASFKVRYPFLGAQGNGFSLQLVVPTGTAPTTRAVLDASTRTLRVMLAGAAGVATATASDVVAAINALERPVLFAALVSEGVVDALPPTALAGGLDPDLSASRGFPKLVPASGVNGGLFLFDQTRPWKLLGVGGQLSGNRNPVTIEVVNVDKALQVLPGRVLLSSQNVNDSGHRITGSRLDFPIMPGQAVLVNCGNVQGTVMVYATAIAALDNIAD